MKPGFLVLEDGTVFRGESIGISGFTVGEVVFNTAMTGYQEILTDPSYAKQIVTLTYPHIGNTGLNEEDSESDNVWCEGLVVRDVPGRMSSWRASQSLAEFLSANGIVGISGVDTRYLTRLIREKGALAGCMVGENAVDADKALEHARDFKGLSGLDLAQVVSRSDILEWDSGSWRIESGYRTGSGDKKLKVVAFDFGVNASHMDAVRSRQRQSVYPFPAHDEDFFLAESGCNGFSLSKIADHVGSFDGVVGVSGEDDGGASGQQPSDGLMRFAAHYDAVVEGQLLEDLLIVAEFPGYSAVDADHAILRCGDNQGNPHHAQTAMGAAILG